MWIKEVCDKTVPWIAKAFSDNGQPSSSRLTSFWLSVSSMALIWFIVRHALYLKDVSQQGVWISNLPAIIYALAAFTGIPYGINRVSNMFQRKDGDGIGNQRG